MAKAHKILPDEDWDFDKSVESCTGGGVDIDHEPFSLSLDEIYDLVNSKDTSKVEEDLKKRFGLSFDKEHFVPYEFHLLKFIRDCLVVDREFKRRTKVRAFYNVYLNWCKYTDYDHLSICAFSEKIISTLPFVKKIHSNDRYWSGIRINPEVSHVHDGEN